MENRLLTPIRAGFIVAAIVGVISLILYASQSRISVAQERSSYDSLFDYFSRLSPLNLSTSDVVLIYMDEASYHDLNQPYDRPWDRDLHAQLLDRLTQERARAVAFDIIFSGAGPSPTADERFTESISRNGHVVLAGDYVVSTSTDGGSMSFLPKTLTLPYEPFLKAAAGWGMAQLQPDDDFTVRVHYHSDQRDSYPSLSWATMKLTLKGTSAELNDPLRERWVRYYGGPETIPSVSYRDVLAPGILPTGYFRDKIVVIGARPMTGSYNGLRDELRSPFTGSKNDFALMPNVEIHATELLNLLRHDWLNRLPSGFEILLLAIAAAVSSLVFCRLRPVRMVPVAVGFFLTALGVVYVGFRWWNIWFDWQTILLTPIALAAVGSVLYRTAEWYVLRQRFRARERASQQRIAEQAALLDKAHDAIIVHDFEWKITFWNLGAEAIYGIEHAYAIGRDIRELLYKSEPEKFESARETLLIQGEWSGEQKQLNNAGKAITIESRWSLVRDDEGQPKSVLLINTDVTERRELEAQFLRTQRMESIGTLAGGIAHDLNNVLGPIMMGIELISMRNKDEKLASTLSRMAGSAQRGAGLVKQVLTFARGHEGERMALQASHLIHEMKKIVMETFPRNIEINLREDADLKPVYADATQLHQVLLNLCVNARDAMPDGGTITISAANHATGSAAITGLKPGDYVKLSVSDTGTGIPEEIREKIFEPFFTTKEIGKGTGLGLSTVNTIVKNHGGLLQVLSESGKGTTFHIFIPAAKEGDAKSESSATGEILGGNGELILIVDDEVGIRELAAAALTDQGYRAVIADNGAQALEVQANLSEPIALLVTDIMMPVMDGTRLIAALRKNNPELPVVAMSGLLESAKTKAPQQSNNTLIVSKPFEATKLVYAVQSLLRKSEQAEVPA